jgi:hypothetical protein
MDAAFTAMEHSSVPVGTPVHDVNGERIGTLSGGDPYTLVVSHGLIFQTDYEVPHSDVDRYDDGKLFLKVTRDQITGKAPNG